MGVSFAEYLSTLDQFKPAFMDGYRGLVPPTEIANRLKSLQTHRMIAVLSGGHCPDCHDFVPVFARLAELTADLDVRIFPRDEHPVLAKRFATNEKHYIPTAVIMDGQFQELGRFVERPQLLKDIITSGEDPLRRDRRGAYQMATAEEIINFLFHSL